MFNPKQETYINSPQAHCSEITKGQRERDLKVTQESQMDDYTDTIKIQEDKIASKF